MEFVHETSRGFKGLEALAKEIFAQARDERIVIGNSSWVDVEPTQEYEGLIAAKQDGLFKGILLYSLTDQKTRLAFERQLEDYFGIENSVVDAQGRSIVAETERFNRIKVAGAAGLRNYPFDKPLAFVWGAEAYAVPAKGAHHKKKPGQILSSLIGESDAVCSQLFSYLKQVSDLDGIFLVNDFPEGFFEALEFRETGLYVCREVGTKLDAIIFQGEHGTVSRIDTSKCYCMTKYPVMVWLRDGKY